MFRYFYFITLGQEGVEPVNQLAVALEERRNSSNDAGRVDLLALEGLHDLEEFIVDLGLVAELGLDLVEVEERVLDLRGSGVSAKIVGVGPRARVCPWRRPARPWRGPCGAVSGATFQVLGDGRAEGTGHGQEWPTRARGSRDTAGAPLAPSSLADGRPWSGTGGYCAFLAASSAVL